MSIEDELNTIINEIPYEIRDCFGVYISKENANKLINNAKNIFNVDKEIHFPILYKDIPVGIHRFEKTKLELIKTEDKIKKVYLYEKNNLDNYLKELENISKKYKCYIDGCGCCGSPYIDNLYTINVDNINYRDNKLQYDLEIKKDIKNILFSK